MATMINARIAINLDGNMIIYCVMCRTTIKKYNVNNVPLKDLNITTEAHSIGCVPKPLRVGKNV